MVGGGFIVVNIFPIFPAKLKKDNVFQKFSPVLGKRKRYGFNQSGIDAVNFLLAICCFLTEKSVAVDGKN